MKKHILSIILTSLIITVMSVPLSAASDGVMLPIDNAVPENAIHIKTVEQLASIGGPESEGKYYVLDNNIDLVDEWIPINNFRGIFDGQGHCINNLYVLESSKHLYVGLFGEIDAATIKNVGVNINEQGVSNYNSVYDSIPWTPYAGGLVGSCGSAEIENCYVTGNVFSYGSAGGLVGYAHSNYTLTIKNSSVAGVSISYADTAGGLLGSCSGDGIVIIEDCYAESDVFAYRAGGGLIGHPYTQMILINNCYATGNVETYYHAGGLIGDWYNQDTGKTITIKNCYATGNATALNEGYLASDAGGLIGNLMGTGANITDCYAMGDVYGTYSGGLIGDCSIFESGAMTIERCYAAGDVIKSVYAGGLIGYLSPLDATIKIDNCYRFSNQTIKGNITEECGYLLTESRIEDESYYNGWDFSTVWGFKPGTNNDFPVLRSFHEFPSSWAEDNVTKAITTNLVPRFLQARYTQAVTRAEFCALAATLYETVTGGEITDRVIFDDTNDVYVEKMAAVGVVYGVSDDKFNPDAPLTREQAAVMLSRLMAAVGNPLTKQVPNFTDKDSVSSWALEAVGQMQSTGIMEGMDNNTFAPRAPLTIEQSIVTVLRIYDIVK